MLDFQQKRKIRSMAYNRITIGILLLLILILARSTWIVYNKKQISEEMKDISLRNVEELRLREDELNSKINKLETVTGVEEEIRLKFNVVKEEEKMVVVVEEEVVVSTTSPKANLWQKIRQFFGK